MATTYRTYLRSVGRKPIPANTRTTKRPGDLELVYDPRVGDYVAHRHTAIPLPEPTTSGVGVVRVSRRAA